MLIKQLSIELENRLGNLSRITGVLSRHGISMSAFSIFTTAEGGVLRIIVPHPMLAVDILGNHNYKVVVDDVVCLKLKDVSGSLNTALKVLSDNGVSLDYAYAFTAPDNKAVAVLHCDDVNTAVNVLRTYRMELMTAEDMV